MGYISVNVQIAADVTSITTNVKKYGHGRYNWYVL